ncbi:MAG: DoxX family protein [Verrucomicrobia bacterium]|nr:DoxX family protein [Verrucomicrobiota bacterium]
MQKIISFLGRLCFCIPFIVSGIAKIMRWDAMEQELVNQVLDVLSASYQNAWIQMILDRIVSLAPMVLLIATIVELGGALLILTGLQVRFGALILCLFLIPTTFLFHNFWDLQGAAQELQIVMFLKNLGIFGGGLTLLAFGSGQKKVSVSK